MDMALANEDEWVLLHSGLNKCKLLFDLFFLEKFEIIFNGIISVVFVSFKSNSAC